MKLLYGKPVAEKILAKTQEKIREAKVIPGLAVVLVGDDKPSHLYVSLKEKAAQEIGIFFEKKVFSSHASEEEITKGIEELNRREDIHGIIVQVPLPSGLDTDHIIEAISSEKDTDGFHTKTLKGFLSGEPSLCPVFPRAILELLEATKELLSGKSGIVLVNSDLLGKVLIEALRGVGVSAEYILSTVSKEELEKKVQGADVVVSAVGRAVFVESAILKEGAIVIDGGISYQAGKVVGDVEKLTEEDKVGYLTPVPGGVGPVTVAVLLARVTESALLKQKNQP